jgi:hypothetical protein
MTSVDLTLLAKAIKEFARSKGAYDLLDSTTANGGTWTSGGCWILAEAVHQGFGGELYAILGTSSTDKNLGAVRRPQHIVVKFGDIYIHADGSSRRKTLLKRWTTKEGVLQPALAALDAQAVCSGIPRPEKAEKILSAIRKFMRAERVRAG